MLVAASKVRPRAWGGMAAAEGMVYPEGAVEPAVRSSAELAGTLAQAVGRRGECPEGRTAQAAVGSDTVENRLHVAAEYLVHETQPGLAVVVGGGVGDEGVRR